MELILTDDWMENNVPDVLRIGPRQADGIRLLCALAERAVRKALPTQDEFDRIKHERDTLAERAAPAPAAKPPATVAKGSAGPDLYVYGVLVHSWLGTMHNAHADGIAARVNAAAQCTCPSGDGSLRWPCPAHSAP